MGQGSLPAYLHVSNGDPHHREDDRKSTMMNGYQPKYEDPTEIFAYTATRGGYLVIENRVGCTYA